MKSTTRDGVGSLLASAAVVAVAVVAALAMRAVRGSFEGRAEPFVFVTLVAFVALLALVLPVAAWRGSKTGAPGTAPLTAATVVVVALLAVYFFEATYFIQFPADILIWSESDFVNDILKLQLGYPLYSAEANNESFFYTPGSQLLTFVLASLTGQGRSIAAFRVIQVGFTIGAAIMAVQSWRILVRHAGGAERRGAGPWIWLVTGFLLLCATNQVTNSFNQFIHNDALAQLVSVAAFWLLLRYALDGRRGALWLMALVPALGFFVKQSLGIWAPLYVGYLLVFERPRSWTRIGVFTVAAFGLIAAALAAGTALWGPHFRYWVLDAMANHPVNPLRSVQHLLDAWGYFAIGLAGGWFVIRGERQLQLLGTWLVGMGLLAIETYTSGVAWMLNHLGPGSLIAGIWFAAALPRIGEAIDTAAAGWIARYLRPALAAGVFVLLLQGLGMIRIPLPPLSPDADRYVRDIEAEFAGANARRVLVDVGTWPYFERRILMRDRAPAIGERGYSQTGDFSGFLGRLSRQEYDKILVRNYHSGDFWYDHEMWSVPSGIRAALETWYTEDHVIPRVQPDRPQSYTTYSFSDISVLVPRDLK